MATLKFNANLVAIYQYGCNSWAYCVGLVSNTEMRLDSCYSPDWNKLKELVVWRRCISNSTNWQTGSLNCFHWPGSYSGKCTIGLSLILFWCRLVRCGSTQRELILNCSSDLKVMAMGCGYGLIPTILTIPLMEKWHRERETGWLWHLICSATLIPPQSHG